MSVLNEILDSSNVHDVMSRSEFFERMKLESGLNLDDIDEGTKLPNDIIKISSDKRFNNTQFYLFNIWIKKMHLSNIINIVDSAVYMYKEYFDMDVVTKCLSEENVYLMREELGKRFNVKQNQSTSTLKLFFS